MQHNTGYTEGIGVSDGCLENAKKVDLRMYIIEKVNKRAKKKALR
jgi:hypothetical protein